MSSISYDGRVFAAVTDTGHVGQARGHFRQDGDFVRSDIRGGAVLGGTVVGRRQTDGTIDAVYCMALRGGDLIAGSCRYEPVLLDDGRLRLAEHWRRIDGSSGVSHIEEVPAGGEIPPGGEIPLGGEVPLGGAAERR